MPLHPTTVHFRTDRAAEGPLIWAQLAIWDVFRWLPPHDSTLNLLVQCPVPAGRDLRDVTTAVRRLVERHDSLHTVYVDTPDGPRQRVIGEGDIPLRIHDVGDRGTEEAAAELGEALRRPWFDIGADLPLRVAVLTRDDTPVAVLLAASHMAVDGWSFAIVRGDLLNLLQDPPIAVEPGQQPLQRVEYETSPIGLRREAKALSYWSKHLTGVPTRMIESNRDGRPPNLDWGQIQSPALALATNGLAARFGVPPATVLLAAITLQLAAYTGEREALLRMIVSTRFRPASRALVGAFNENALFRLDFPQHPGFPGSPTRPSAACCTAPPTRHCWPTPTASTTPASSTPSSPRSPPSARSPPTATASSTTPASRSRTRPRRPRSPTPTSPTRSTPPCRRRSSAPRSSTGCRSTPTSSSS